MRFYNLVGVCGGVVDVLAAIINGENVRANCQNFVVFIDCAALVVVMFGAFACVVFNLTDGATVRPLRNTYASLAPLVENSNICARCRFNFGADFFGCLFAVRLACVPVPNFSNFRDILGKMRQLRVIF